jgi:hypothetical protein
MVNGQLYLYLLSALGFGPSAFGCICLSAFGFGLLALGLQLAA